VTRGRLGRTLVGFSRGLALLACAFAFLLGTSAVAMAAPAKKQCKVPAVAGKTQAAAKKALKKANCAVGKVTKKSSKKVAKGKVISSNPKKGTTKKAGTKVKLTVSSGKAAKKQCKVPNVVGKTVDAAKKALKKANCKVGAITQKSSTKVAKGKVISSDPKKGTVKKAGTKVKLTVSSGKSAPPKKCNVPDVVGKTESAAENAITKANCKVGTITQKSSKTVAKGKVISSKPQAGAKKPAGTKVDLVISSGKTAPPSKCNVPDVVGKSQSAAENAITKANCTVGTVTQKSSSTVGKGKVISSNPKAGATKPAGTKVNLVVSTGKASTYPPPKPSADAATADLRRS
jgi:beta-lactam-binding protein with PASTA domain